MTDTSENDTTDNAEAEDADVGREVVYLNISPRGLPVINVIDSALHRLDTS